jgi:dolichyl-phosphate-mannose--protein O-mannosyl transferase
MVLSLALAYVFYRGEEPGMPLARARWAKWVFLGLCFGMFVYFFPILAALKIPAASFMKWMWFRSWV